MYLHILEVTVTPSGARRLYAALARLADGVSGRRLQGGGTVTVSHEITIPTPVDGANNVEAASGAATARASALSQAMQSGAGMAALAAGVSQGLAQAGVPATVTGAVVTRMAVSAPVLSDMNSTTTQAPLHIN